LDSNELEVWMESYGELAMSEGLKTFDDTKPEPEIEKKYFEDLVVLGNAVPDEISDNRITVCTVAYSKEHGLIRIYPVPPNSPMNHRWNVVSVPLERNKKDSRDESWKIQDSKTEWDSLASKIKLKRKLSRKEWVGLIEHLKEHHSYGCIEDINDKRLSLGIIVPKILDKKLEKRKNVDTVFQTTLVNENLFMTINNYGVRPVISYRCPTCRTKKQQHNQGVIEWGVYESLRREQVHNDQVWHNLRIDDSDYDISFLVGNMNLHRSKFLIISVFRYKR